MDGSTCETRAACETAGPHDAPCGARRNRNPVFGGFSRAAAAVCAAAILWTCGGWHAQAAGSGSIAPAPLELTLHAAIGHVLRNNRRLISARLDRVVSRFELRVAENRFRPRLTVGPYVERAGAETSGDTNEAGLASMVTLRVPTGGELGVRLSSGAAGGDVPADSRYSNQLAFTFKQPLLRGAGSEIDTAPVRIARVGERIDVLAFEQTVADVISSVVGRYRDLMQAERRVEIRTRSLDRARELLEVNRLLVRTGRMAERDIVQTRADIASREIQLVSARNSLDKARLALIDVLDVDSRTEIRLADTLADVRGAEPLPAGLDEAVETALRNRPDYRRALLGIENARTRVAVAEDAVRWDLSATLSMSFAGADGSFGRAAGDLGRRNYGARLELLVPLGAASTDPRERDRVAAAIGLRRARNDLADLRQRIDIEVGGAVRETELARRQVELARTARELVEEKTRIEKEKLRLGLSSNFRLVAFEDDLVAAENRELDALVGWLDALTGLDRTLGTTLERWSIAIGQIDREPPR